MFPFNNSITTFTMTGLDLRNSLNDVQNIYFPVWNIQPLFKNYKRARVKSIILPSLLGNDTFL